MNILDIQMLPYVNVQKQAYGLTQTKDTGKRKAGGKINTHVEQSSSSLKDNSIPSVVECLFQ